MAPEEGYLIGDLSLLVERDDCECAAAAGLPIDREVFGVGLHKIGVPGIATDVQVIIAKLLSGGLAKDVPCAGDRGRMVSIDRIAAGSLLCRESGFLSSASSRTHDISTRAQIGQP
jgi:hypothetical protein